ncbi:inter-alpha-trypsin inhibitor heavy chain H3-like isoform X2 [Nelusetta ayraudi]|uniref:inter-alpha-trypsin inhibitor heavy chain H3-like isoform X2 n=1 Tax=Nelusetta ayraudi TaxID=303726 RepID=UPI003F710A36
MGRKPSWGKPWCNSLSLGYCWLWRRLYPTGFINRKEYDGVVKAKEQAQQQYDAAVFRGESAGIVSSVGRTLEEFKTSVTVAPHKKITFELTYEELLKRRLGKYELQIHARPMQPVRDFKVDVHISEKAGISFLVIKGGLNTNALANAVTRTDADKEAWVYFYPSEDQQKMCDSCGDEGLNGDLVILYDVNRNNSLGDIEISNGYFVHHFAPSNLVRLSKNVVFVINQSGSMHGRKIEQTRIALIHILNDLAEDDYFGVISFDSNLFHWKRELVQATSANVDSAKIFAQNIKDRGATNINSAVLEGARMLNANPREGSASILILLTDGEPTTGVINLDKIQSNVKRAIAGKFPLYCLGFGFDVNFEFLESMALQNDGTARRIYEDADANLQLQGFYEEVATPLLTDVTMVYVGGTNLTQTNFSQYYNGSEIVVAGEITNNDIETFTPQVVAISSNTRMVFNNPNISLEPPETKSDRIQRVCAYLTVKQLMEKELQLSGPEKDNVKEEALRLSLKYNFVTPFTSMVVTKPTGDITDVHHKPKEGARSHHVQQNDDSHGSRGAHGESGQPGPPCIPGFSSNMFLVSHPDSQNDPLCLDVTGGLRLKLLHHPSRGLSVNGELDSGAGEYFSRIKIHLGPEDHVEIDTTGVTVRQDQATTHHNGQDTITIGSVTVIFRDKEIDVNAGDTRLVILIYERNGKKMFWPALRQRSQDPNIEGILVFQQVYRLVQIIPTTTILEIDGQYADVTRADAVDYSIVSTPTLSCWLVSSGSGLHRRLENFIVTEL